MTLWQTRVGRSKSKESQLPPSTPAISPPPLVQDSDTHYRPSVLEFKFDSAMPGTPALDSDKYPIEHFVQSPMVDEDRCPIQDIVDVTKPSGVDSPSSPASVASTSPSMPSPSMSPLNPVTSVFRSISDTRVFTDPSPPKVQPTSSTLFPAMLPVPSIPSWRKFSYSSKSKDPPPASTAPKSTPLTLLSFAPIPTPWRSTRCVSDSVCPQPSTSAFSFPSVGFSSALSPRAAAENAINNVHHVCQRPKGAVNNNSISRGSPYGELVVVDIVAARDLSVDRDENGVDLPFTVAMQLCATTRQTAPVDRGDCTVNERFVIWLPSSPTIDQRTLDLFVHGGNKRDLGEVHLSLAMPVNEAFIDWYPVVCRTDGRRHGAVRVAIRRLVITSSPLLEAAQTLAARERSLNYDNREVYEELLPELWSHFPGAEPGVIASNPTEEPLGNKLTGRRRTSSQEPSIQRDVF